MEKNQGKKNKPSKRRRKGIIIRTEKKIVIEYTMYDNYIS
jgi:hypothetical protein